MLGSLRRLVLRGEFEQGIAHCPGPPRAGTAGAWTEANHPPARPGSWRPFGDGPPAIVRGR
jgi:hypothetical protein